MKVWILDQVLVTHTCNPSYSGGTHQEDHILRPAWANLETLSQKYLTQNRAVGVSLMVECLPSKHEALSTNPTTISRKKSLSFGRLYITYPGIKIFTSAKWHKITLCVEWDVMLGPAAVLRKIVYSLWVLFLNLPRNVSLEGRLSLN
jgi:hypothetical protein